MVNLELPFHIGTLTNATFDNAGGNASLGFVECFNARYSCRVCMLPKEETQSATRENKLEYRTRETYLNALEIIDDSSHVDVKETKGIKRRCSLNKLKYFHILDNFNFDPMHDIYEGIAPFFLQRLIESLVEKKVFSFATAVAYIENFDYGKLNRQNIPSTFIDKKNVGQSSSQLRCLLLHLPFIFYDFKDHPEIKDAWIGVTTLLNIIKYVHSADLYDRDLHVFEDLITQHLTFVKTYFNVNLIPKHHNLTHYASAIRLVGPVVHMSTMRYESKHKSFTDQAKLSNNHMNIGNYIARRHQQLSCFKTKYEDDVKMGMLRIVDGTLLNEFEYLLYNYFKKLEEVRAVAWARVNSNHYVKKLFVIDTNILFEIEAILHFRNEIYFLCTQFKIKSFNSFLNSVLIEANSPISQRVIKHNDLSSTKSYEKKIIDGNFYIIADCLEIDRIMS